MVRPPHDMKIFTGSANRSLGESVSRYLKVPLGKTHLSRFLDGEVWFQIEENVRGKDVFVLQSTSTPVNEHLMELLIMIDALKRASAARITAVIPYYGYARQDRKDRPRVPISAKLVANLISVAGCNRVLTMDLHGSQIQGFFGVPVDHLFAAPVIIDHVAQMGLEDLCVVSPDAGGVERARAYAKRLGATLAIVDKRRETANVAEVHNVIGDVSGKTVLIVDDLVDTAGTLCKVAEALAESGAGKILASASHAVLSGNAVRNINASRISQLIVTDSIEERPERKSDKIVVLPIGELMGKAIQNIHEEASITSLFI